MKPSDFIKHPWSSVLQNAESETIAQNIMVILKRTGDQWRKLPYEEYEAERLKDGNYNQRERAYFDNVIDFTVTPEAAAAFSPTWKEINES